MFTRLLLQRSAHWARSAWPSQCAVCSAWPTAPVCAACVQRFTAARPRCLRCALPLAPRAVDGGAAAPCCMRCLRQPPPLTRTWAALDYAYPWSGLISQYKFEPRPGWAGFWAASCRAAPGLNDFLSSMAPQDWIVPMPLSEERLAERGFNQAWALARAVAQQSGCRAAAHAQLLLRIRATRAQSQLSRAERLVNVRGAFAVAPLRASSLQGRRVLVVDDVMTSGASLYAAAHTLLQAGASEVSALVIARTEA